MGFLWFGIPISEQSWLKPIPLWGAYTDPQTSSLILGGTSGCGREGNGVKQEEEQFLHGATPMLIVIP